MKLNWKPSRPVFLDFEVQSEVDLTESTHRKYARHPSTRALTCVLKKDDKTYTFGPYLDTEAKMDLASLTKDCTIVAHNAPFDHAIWEKEGLPEREWYDTIPPARAAGLPGSLEQLGQVLFKRGKDPNGKRLINLLCIVKNGKYPDVKGPALGLLKNYNERDVDLLEQVFHRVHGYGEPDVMTVDRIVNDRGIPVDNEFANKLAELFEENKTKGDAIFNEKYGTNPRSPTQMLDWLNRQGFALEGVNKATIKNFLASPEDVFHGDNDMGQALEFVKQAFSDRQEVVSVGPGKARRALQAIDDDHRMRDQFVIYGAGPGRWSGRQLQPHNLPSVISRQADLLNVVMTYEGIHRAAAEASTEESKVAAADILAGMLRHIVRAPSMCVSDYAQVEARCVAWLADCEHMLNIFADMDRSIYVDMGEKLYGRTIHKKRDLYEYTLCKALVLGCTYGMSGQKFEYTCLIRGEHKALQTMRDAGMTANDAVKLYRTSYPEIPRLWRRYDDAAKDAVKGIPTETGKAKFYMKGPDLHIELPSGRPIVYRNARMEMMVPAYCKMYGMPEVPVPTVVYDNMRGGFGFLYGSKICENISQGTCRDLLAASMVHSEQEGLNPFIHVHDEEGNLTEKLERSLEIMSYQHPWAKGFPILAEGYVGNIWTKSPKGFREGMGLNGKVLTK